MKLTNQPTKQKNSNHHLCHRKVEHTFIWIIFQNIMFTEKNNFASDKIANINEDL